MTAALSEIERGDPAKAEALRWIYGFKRLFVFPQQIAPDVGGGMVKFLSGERLPVVEALKESAARFG